MTPRAISSDRDLVLTLRPLPTRPNGPDESQRLRKLLKTLLRAYDLKCVDIRSALPAPPPELDVEKSEPPFHPQAGQRDSLKKDAQPPRQDVPTPRSDSEPLQRPDAADAKPEASKRLINN